MKSVYSFLSSKYSLLIACVLFSLLSFWIYKNITLSDLTGSQAVKGNIESFSPNQSRRKILKLEIRNGDIVSVLSPDLVELIVNHSDLDNVEGIISLSYSTKTGKMCFIAETITPKWMYVANTDSTDLKRIDLGSKCGVSPDGTKAAYINHVTDVRRTDIYLYRYSSGKSVNLTEGAKRMGYQRNYVAFVWVSDEIIRAEFFDWLEKDYQTSINGTSEINVSTGKIVDK
jgi:hypothetical protein